MATTAFNEAGGGRSFADTLQQVDTILFWLGSVLFVMFVFYWVVRRVSNRPTRAAAGENTLTPELLLLPVAAFVLAYSLSWPILRRVAEGHAEQGAELAANSVAMIAATAACLWIGQRFFDGGVGRFLIGDGRIGRQVAEGIGWWVVSLPLCAIICEVTVRSFDFFLPEYELPEHDVINALRDANEPPWAVFTLWAGSVFIAPLAEECFFRGLLQTLFRNLIHRRWAAVLMAAILFGLAHHGQWHVVPAIALLGVILGFVYERSGSLAGPITLHALFNFRTLLWEAYGLGGP